MATANNVLCTACNAYKDVRRHAIVHEDVCVLHPDNIKAAIARRDESRRMEIEAENAGRHKCEICRVTAPLGQPLDHIKGCYALTRPVDDLASRRFHKAANVNIVAPRDALVTALQEFDAMPAEQRPSHVAIVMGYGPEHTEPNTLQYFQGGNYGMHAQAGLMFDAAAAMRERS